VEEALKKQKLNKAPGGDNIPAELLKAGGQEGIIALHGIINKVGRRKDTGRLGKGHYMSHI
jgi:hypothetical protein